MRTPRSTSRDPRFVRWLTASALLCASALTFGQRQSQQIVSVQTPEWDAAMEVAMFSSTQSSTSILVANHVGRVLLLTDGLGNVIATVKPQNTTEIPATSCGKAGALGLATSDEQVPLFLACRAGAFYSVRIRAGEARP